MLVLTEWSAPSLYKRILDTAMKLIGSNQFSYFNGEITDSEMTHSTDR